MDRRRRRVIGGAVAVVIALVGAVAWFGPLDDRIGGADQVGVDRGDPASVAADRFAEAWVDGTLDEVPATEASGQVAERSLFVSAGLGPVAGRAPTDVEVTSLAAVPSSDGDAPARVRASLEVTWTLDAGRTWTHDSTVDLVEQTAVEGADPVWLVDWEPTVVHPKVTGAGHRLAALRAAANRGEILGLDGQPIVGLRPVVFVSIDPDAAADPEALALQVAEVVGVDAASLVDRVEAAPAGEAVSVVTLRREVYEPLAPSLEGVPGVVLTEGEIPLAPSRDFARALLGVTGPAGEEDVAASGGQLQLGEITGLSGLQASQDEVLSGRAELSIRLDRSSTNEPPLVLEDLPAEPGRSITVSLDPDVQAAADQALRGAPKPAALVAIRVSTGDVLAVANGPEGADGFNRAMVGTYPPGSTFKIASALAYLDAGLTPDTIVACPATIVVGKEFRNAEGEVLGDVPFRTDFAESCNTAFVGQSTSVTSAQLAEVAASLGYRDLEIGVPVADPSVPVTESDTEHAAQSIGQGKVLATPFTVALASASVAAGRSVTPRLLVDPSAPAAQPGAPLPAGSIAALRAMMRGVVTDGTGSAVAAVPGGDVYAKTGTAEYGTDDPPRTHAWFTGYQGDIAFAVLVEDGGFGGEVAAPLAAQFLTSLAG